MLANLCYCDHCHLISILVSLPSSLTMSVWHVMLSVLVNPLRSPHPCPRCNPRRYQHHILLAIPQTNPRPCPRCNPRRCQHHILLAIPQTNLPRHQPYNLLLNRPPNLPATLPTNPHPHRPYNPLPTPHHPPQQFQHQYLRLNPPPFHPLIPRVNLVPSL